MENNPAENLKDILEAVLFVSPEPVSPQTMKKLHGTAGIPEWKEAASRLIEEYNARNTAIRVVELAEGYKMVTRPEVAHWVRKYTKASASGKLSNAALETLSIIAYRQPVIRAEIDAIRGVSSDGVLRTLLDRKLVKILGRKEMPGRPLLYGTTREFLEYFGLKSIAEMPTLKDMEDEPVEPSLLPAPPADDVIGEDGETLNDATTAEAAPAEEEPNDVSQGETQDPTGPVEVPGAEEAPGDAPPPE